MTSSQKQILYVDDQKDDCDLFQFILSEAGYGVTSAQSVANALQLLATSHFDLCLFDLSLADGTGFELLEKVQSLDPSVPIIICSGSARDEIKQQVMQAGAQAFFSKPIDYDSLVETIAQLIHSNEPAVDFPYVPSHNLADTANTAIEY